MIKFAFSENVYQTAIHDRLYFIIQFFWLCKLLWVTDHDKGTPLILLMHIGITFQFLWIVKVSALCHNLVRITTSLHCLTLSLQIEIFPGWPFIVMFPCCRASSVEWQTRSLDCSQHHGSQAGWGERRRRVQNPSLAHHRHRRSLHQGSPLSLHIQSLLGGHSGLSTLRKVRKTPMASLCLMCIASLMSSWCMTSVCLGITKYLACHRCKSVRINMSDV